MKRIFLIVISLLALNGCGMVKLNQPTATIEIQSAQYLNPNMNGDASPVVINIYQLTTPYAFQQATYQALSQHSSTILGSSLIDKNTIEVRPDTHKNIEQSLSPNTRYLGIVAQYREINSAKWKQVITLNHHPAKHPHIHLILESEAAQASLSTQNNHTLWRGF